MTDPRIYIIAALYAVGILATAIIWRVIKWLNRNDIQPESRTLKPEDESEPAPVFPVAVKWRNGVRWRVRRN